MLICGIGKKYETQPDWTPEAFVTKLGPKEKIVLIGTLSGAVILGLLTRLAMAMIALSSNHPVNVSMVSRNRC